MLAHAVEQGEERVPEATSVVEHHALVVIAYRGGSNNGEDLVEGADTTGKSNDEVAALYHQRLAVVKVVASNVDIYTVARTTRLLKNGGNNADDHGTGIVRLTSHSLHQSEVGTAIDERMTLMAYPAAKLTGSIKKLGGNVFICRTENADVHFSFYPILILLHRSKRRSSPCEPGTGQPHPAKP